VRPTPPAGSSVKAGRCVTGPSDQPTLFDTSPTTSST
jgi:hypothetical protein